MRQRFTKGFRRERTPREPQGCSKVWQVSEATVWPIDRLGEGADVPGQGHRWKDWFGKAIGLWREDSFGRAVPTAGRRLRWTVQVARRGIYRPANRRGAGPIRR